MRLYLGSTRHLEHHSPIQGDGMGEAMRCMMNLAAKTTCLVEVAHKLARVFAVVRVLQTV
jgi:hypothetical protein